MSALFVVYCIFLGYVLYSSQNTHMMFVSSMVWSGGVLGYLIVKTSVCPHGMRRVERMFGLGAMLWIGVFLGLSAACGWIALFYIFILWSTLMQPV